MSEKKQLVEKIQDLAKVINLMSIKDKKEVLLLEASCYLILSYTKQLLSELEE